jgi:hypothetical protein
MYPNAFTISNSVTIKPCAHGYLQPHPVRDGHCYGATYSYPKPVTDPDGYYRPKPYIPR